MSKFSLLLVALLLGAARCDETTPIHMQVKDLPGSRWEMRSFLGSYMTAQNFSRGLPFVLFADSTSLSGSTGCNVFAGSYQATDSTISIRVAATSKMACPGDFEARFLEAMGEVNHARVTGDSMLLYRNNTELMLFLRSDSTSGRP